MKSTPVSPRASRRHSEVATEGDRSTRNAGSLGLRNTDGGGTNVYPVRIQHFIGANVVEVDNAEVNILIGGGGANLPNDDGATLAYGAVVVATAAGLVTTTVSQDTRPVGVVQRSTSDTETAPAIFVGYVAQVNTTGTVNADDFLETSTSAGLARSSGTTRRVGTFGRALAAGPNPPAIIHDPDAITGSGPGGSGVAGLIGMTAYGGAGSYTTSTTFADMDATNLAVTFTAPSTGNVLIRLTTQVYQVASDGVLIWGLREGGSVVAGPHVVASGEGNGTTNRIQTISKPFLITGLTPGSGHTYKWAAKHSVNAWVHRWENATDSHGVVTMEVQAAP